MAMSNHVSYIFYECVSVDYGLKYLTIPINITRLTRVAYVSSSLNLYCLELHISKKLCKLLQCILFKSLRLIFYYQLRVFRDR